MKYVHTFETNRHKSQADLTFLFEYICSNDQTQFLASFLRLHQTEAQPSFEILCLIVTHRIKICFCIFADKIYGADLYASLLFSVNFKNCIQYFKSS